MNQQWFDISNEGWRRMNAGRPPHELVKELVQNILDESFSEASINFGMRKGKFYLVVEDDVTGGIADSSLITTVFMTGKEDSPEKRGRKGRGLKEFLSVCESASVETAGKTIVFNSDGTRKEIANTRQSGTKIECVIVEEGWNGRARGKIERFLLKIILRNGDRFEVNGKALAKRQPTWVLPATLDTHVIEEGVQKTIQRKTDVALYEKVSKKGWLYEMGIPVIETDMPFDVDICQRIPMNDNRNDVSAEYTGAVKRAIIEGKVSHLDKEDMLSWAKDALDYRLTWGTRRLAAMKIMDGDPDNFVLSTSKVYDDKAKQKGREVFDTKGMPYDLRNLLSSVVSSSDRYVKSVERNTLPVDVEPTEAEQKFVDALITLTRRATGLKVKGKVVVKEMDTSGMLTEATYSKQGKERVISWNRLAFTPEVLADPFCERALDTLIHELGHEKSSVHENFVYVNAVTKYAAKIAVYLMKKASPAQQAPSKKKPVSKPKAGDTTMDRLKRLLPSERYMNLRVIYEEMGATTTGDKAGIRGVLNRNCLSEDSAFERFPQGGAYRLRS